jgi:hypothetical protein
MSYKKNLIEVALTLEVINNQQEKNLIEEGIEKGIEINKLEIAKKLLKKNFP